VGQNDEHQPRLGGTGHPLPHVRQESAGEVDPIIRNAQAGEHGSHGDDSCRTRVGYRASVIIHRFCHWCRYGLDMQRRYGRHWCTFREVLRCGARLTHDPRLHH
jgi:hypothetical protein